MYYHNKYVLITDCYFVNFNSVDNTIEKNRSMKEKVETGEKDDEEESQLTESNLPVDKGYAWVVVFGN